MYSMGQIKRSAEVFSLMLTDMWSLIIQSVVIGGSCVDIFVNSCLYYSEP